MLVELAWLWLRYQPESALSQWFKRIIGLEPGTLRPSEHVSRHLWLGLLHRYPVTFRRHTAAIPKRLV